jgi:hypothetical protein
MKAQISSAIKRASRTTRRAPSTGGRTVRMKMRPLRRRTRVERVVSAARNAQLPSGVRSAVPGIHASKRVKSGVAAVVGTTAASAAISALRRRVEGPRSSQ